MTKIFDKIKISQDAGNISSAAGHSSQRFNMSGSHNVVALVSVFSSGGIGAVTMDFLGSTNSTHAGSTNSSFAAGITIGCTENTVCSYAKSFTLTMASVATGATGDSFTINGRTFTFTTVSTLGSTASTSWTSTKFYFGSSVGSTENTGLKLSIESLKACLEDDRCFGKSIVCATNSTCDLKLTLADDVSTYFTFASTASTLFFTAAANHLVGAFSIDLAKISKLGTGYTHVGAKVSSASTAGSVHYTFISVPRSNAGKYAGYPPAT